MGKPDPIAALPNEQPTEGEALAALLDVVVVSEAQSERARRCELMMRQQLQVYGRK